MKQKILIVEPSELIAEGLLAVLGQQSTFKIVGVESDAQALQERVLATRPNVLVVNAGLAQYAPECFDFELPVVGIVYQYVPQTRLAKFDAIIDINDSRGTVAETLKTVCSANDSTEKTGDSSAFELTRRESSVLVEIANGLTSKEIADKLNVSVNTVITHRKNISHKTGIKSVAGLTVYAMLNNLISDAPA